MYNTWILIDDTGLVLVNRNHNEKLVKMTKKGIPQGSISFNTQREALDELYTMEITGKWPLWSRRATAKQCMWR